MAKKKKKKNTGRKIVLSIVGLIILFALTLLVTIGPLADYLNIGFKIPERVEPTFSTEETQKPKNTWEPDREKETEAPAEKSTEKPKDKSNTKPQKTPVPHDEGDPVDLRGGEYLYDTHRREITENELKEMSRQEIKYIYWEIFARHGYTFETDELANYFESNHSWYMPITTDETAVRDQFNSLERRNEKTIFNYQKKMGWR